jgi:hypothetical protein
MDQFYDALAKPQSSQSQKQGLLKLNNAIFLCEHCAFARVIIFKVPAYHPVDSSTLKNKNT